MDFKIKKNEITGKFQDIVVDGEKVGTVEKRRGMWMTKELGTLKTVSGNPIKKDAVAEFVNKMQ